MVERQTGYDTEVHKRPGVQAKLLSLFTLKYRG